MTREPRAHWVLLVLAMVVVLAGLCANGYVRHIGAEGVGPARPRGAAALPAGTGSIISVGPKGTIVSRSVPPHTVALTFDDGPDPRWTPMVLDVLAAHHVHATFFVIGSQVDENPALTRRILAGGNEIGAHSFSHRDLSNLPGWQRRLELTLAQGAIIGATGRRATLARPPYSSETSAVTPRDLAVLRDTADLGQLTVLSDLDTKDWSQRSVEAIVKAGVPTDDRGEIVLMHDGGGDRSRTVDALDDLLTMLAAKGYRVGSVSEALGLSDPNPPVGSGLRLRGEALRYTQVAASWLVGAMTTLLAIALALTVLRLILQVISARRHQRRSRGHRRRRYVGPVSVIVPAFNESANIAATVRSLARNDYPDIEVIVVDDGSTDGTAEVVWRLGIPGIRVVRQPNAGKAVALNTGLSYARNEVIVMVDADTVFEPDAIGRLVQAFADPAVGAVSGNTKVANRKGLLGRWQHLEYVIGFNLDRRLFDLGECMPTVPGAIGAFRREALSDVAGVSTQTLAEDTDLTMAILRAGWRVIYDESAIAWTEVPVTLRQLWRQRYRWCYGTMQAMWKHRAAWVERGAGGRFGRRGLTYLLLFQVSLPLSAPAIDIYAIYCAIFLPLERLLVVWLGFMLLQALAAAYALRLDRESLRPLWALPLQQLVYRQLMYLVVVQSAVTAVVGSRLRWHHIPRAGRTDLLLRR